MDTLPDHVKQLIYEYDNTYHDIFDGVMVEMESKREGIATYALVPLGDNLCVRRKCYRFKHLYQHRFHWHTHTSLTYSYDDTPNYYPL